MTATGGAGYTLDHASGLPTNAHVVPGAHRLDAFTIAPTTSSNGQAVLQVQLGL